MNLFLLWSNLLPCPESICLLNELSGSSATGGNGPKSVIANTAAANKRQGDKRQGNKMNACEQQRDMGKASLHILQNTFSPIFST